MKKILLLSITFLIVISCHKDSVDPCVGITCLNGGFCESGLCKCPAGFFGKNCETKLDPCTNIVCRNGGNCINGICNCPVGYGGSDCGTILTPRYVRITKVQNTKFPSTDASGVSWDFSSGPDLFFNITKTGSTTIIFSSPYNSDVPPGVISTWSNLTIDLDQPNNFYTIQLFDWDFPSADDLISTINFKPFNGTSFPSSVVVSSTSVAYTISLQYTF